jgi:hypothetical protein
VNEAARRQAARLGKGGPIMAVKHVDIKGYCDSLYGELSDMKNRLIGLRGRIEGMEGKNRSVLDPHVRHLDELIQSIDWKLEIFAKSCPVDWNKFGLKSETTASVPTTEGEMPAAGYGGG